MTLLNPHDSIQAMITDSAVNVAQDNAPLSTPPQSSDFPYVVIWGDLPTEVSGRGHGSPNLADDPESLDATVRLTYAALSKASLYWLINRVRPLLDRRQPIMDGYHCERLRINALQFMEQDRSIPLPGNLHPVYAIDETRFIAHKS